MVTAFVRPEHITAEKAEKKSRARTTAVKNVISGTVESLLFNGANSRVLVREQSGDLVEAEVVLTGGTQDMKPGDDVILNWAAQQTMCFFN